MSASTPSMARIGLIENPAVPSKDLVGIGTYFKANLPPFEAHYSHLSQLQAPRLCTVRRVVCCIILPSQVPCWPVGSGQEATVAFGFSCASRSTETWEGTIECMYILRTCIPYGKQASEDLLKDQNHIQSK